MAKYEEPFDDTQKLFDEILRNMSLDRLISVKILTCNTLKELGKIVKANDLVKHMTNEDIIVILNERVFDQLDQEAKFILAEDLLTRIEVNPENGKVAIIKPTVQTYRGILEKWTFDKFIRATDLVDIIFKQIEEEENQRSAQTA